MATEFDELPPGFEIQERGLDELPPGFEVRRTSAFEDVTETMARGMVRGIPIAGPFIESGIELLESVLPESFGGMAGQPIEAIQARGQALREEHPVLDIGSEFAGGMAAMSPVVGMAPRAFGAAGSFGQRLLASTVSGGAIGAADVAARGGDPLTGGAIGAAGGAAGVAIGGALGRAFARREATPTAQALRQQAQPLFERADDVGLVVMGDRFQEFAEGLAETARREGIDAIIHPKATRALVRLQSAVEESLTGDLDLRDITILRRTIGAAAGSADADEVRIATMLRDKLDDFLAGLKPDDFAAGDPEVALPLLRQARELWRKAARAEVIEDAIEKAERMAAGNRQTLANSLRTQFRQIANNKKTMRKFTPEQRKAIDAVTKETSAAAVLEKVGGLRGTAIGIVGAMSIDMALGGPVALAGMGAQKAGQELSARGARGLADVAQHMAATDMPQLLTPSARSRVFGTGLGYAAGVEAGRVATQPSD